MWVKGEFWRRRNKKLHDHYDGAERINGRYKSRPINEKAWFINCGHRWRSETRGNFLRLCFANTINSILLRSRSTSKRFIRKRIVLLLLWGHCGGSIRGRTQPAIFQETIERGMRSGELGNDVNAKILAQTLIVSMIGLTVFMKSRPDRTFAENAVATILALLK
jgi:hypothetical protein